MKVYISAMASERKKAIVRITSYSKEITSNIIKLGLYSDNQRDHQHWIDEIATWFADINNVDLKSRNPRFSAEEYDEMIFGYFGDEYKDIPGVIHSWQLKNRKSHKYPDVVATRYDVDRVFSLATAIRTKFCKIFADPNNEETRSSLKSKLIRIVDMEV